MTIPANADGSENRPIDIDSLRWNYRVILVYAPEPLASRARSNLEEFAAGIEERDIAWFVLNGETLETNLDGELKHGLREQLVRTYFTPTPTATSVVLIGKDGGIKSRTSDLDLESTFGLIDQMPMRRAEMRRQANPSDLN